MFFFCSSIRVWQRTGYVGGASHFFLLKISSSGIIEKYFFLAQFFVCYCNLIFKKYYLGAIAHSPTLISNDLNSALLTSKSLVLRPIINECARLFGSFS